MRFSVNVPNFGDFGDPRVLADLARRAEAAGWDALFVWDHIVQVKRIVREFADPWVLLTAAGLATERIRLGTMITPVPRRRPAKLAREVTTVDQLTGGRFILGVGLGAPVEDEYGSFGEPTDLKVLAERLDEGLEALRLLWSGEPVSFRGKHVTLDDVRFLPTPVQRPRVPVWVGGMWPLRTPMRRAARWDGAIPIMGRWGTAPSPEDVRELSTFLRAQRAAAGLSEQPYEVVVGGISPTGPAGRDLVGPLAEAGATWWDERMPFGPDLERREPMLRRVEAGPPTV